MGDKGVIEKVTIFYNNPGIAPIDSHHYDVMVLPGIVQTHVQHVLSVRCEDRVDFEEGAVPKPESTEGMTLQQRNGR